MSVTLNGSTGYLEWNKGAGTLPVTAYPFSIVLRLKSGTNASMFAAGICSSSADRNYAAWFNFGGFLAYARSPGLGYSASVTASITAMKLAIVTFDSATRRTVTVGDNTFSGVDTNSISDQVSVLDRIVIGCQHYNAGSAGNFFNGDIAEVHFFNRALAAADYDTLAADYKPELLSGWQDGWSLKDASDLTSLGGSRTLTLVGGVTSTGSHPITRLAPGPTISVHPSNQTVTTPATATFSVTAAASGGGTLSYQWQRNPAGAGSFANVSTGTGGTTSSYTTAATSVSGGNANSTDTWRCVVTETGGTNAGSTNSNAATLTVNAAPSGPTINTQPSNQTVTSPGTATFTVAATASGGTLSYQWQRSTNGGGSWANVSTGTGGTTASYTTPATSVSGGSANNADQYRCAVTDSNGTVNSSAAALTVNAAPASLTSSPLKSNAGVLHLSAPFEAFVNNATTGVLVVRKTGLTSHASTGVCTFTDAALAAATQYSVRWRRTDTGAQGIETLTAA